MVLHLLGASVGLTMDAPGACLIDFLFGFASSWVRFWCYDGCPQVSFDICIQIKPPKGDRSLRAGGPGAWGRIQAEAIQGLCHGSQPSGNSGSQAEREKGGEEKRRSSMVVQQPINSESDGCPLSLENNAFCY